MRHHRRAWWLVPLVLAWAAGAFPQTNGSIVGVVTDAGTGKPIAHALIVARSTEGIETSAESDESGAYRLALPPGSYTVRALHHQYRSPPGAEVTIDHDQSARANFAITQDEEWQQFLPPPPPRKAPPVYNAVFAPTVASTRSTLFDAKPTAVRFFIGPRDAQSAVAAADWTVNPKLLEDKKNVPLVVTMSCPFCSEPRTQRRPMTYYGAKRSSTEARFQFTPFGEQLATTGGVGRIGFEITRDGKQVDYVVVEVVVVHGGVQLGKEPLLPPHVANLELPKDANDIDLTLSVREIGNTIEIQLEPNDPELTKLLHRKFVAKDGGLRSFRSALKVNELQPLLGRFYLDLTGAVENDKRLKEQLSGSAASAVASVSALALSPKDETVLVDLLGRTGAQLYAGLFSSIDGDPDLAEMMETIQGYARNDRPLRLRIDTDGIYLPWQVLVPPGQISAGRMWGFRYELSVSPTGVTLPGRYQGHLVYRDGPWLFGRYRGNSPEDEVTRLGALQLEALQSRLKVKGIVSIDSRDVFLQQLVALRQRVQVLMTFTHARSATIINPNGTASLNLSGPSVQFANDDYLPVGELSALVAQVPMRERVLGNSPIVFLNGCETGTSGFFETSNQDFAGTFLRLGARGVVVTEAPIWTYFGYTFGLKFLERLNRGITAPGALLQTRIEFLKAHNPLGLLYSYYGGPDVRITFAP